MTVHRSWPLLLIAVPLWVFSLGVGAANASPDEAPPSPAPEEAAPAGTVLAFAGEVPEGWARKGVVLAHKEVVVVGDDSGKVSLLCTPMQAANGPVEASVTRAFVLPETESGTWSRIEARSFGANKQALPGAKPRLLQAISRGTAMSTVPVSFTPAEGAAFWRICVKTGGNAKGSTVVKEVRVP